jgi:hypothetical protein
MLMGEVGIDPTISVETIKAAWPQLQRRFEQALERLAETRSG